ncbi:S8 family serine peptidase [Plantactinospora solaniradicis]|uniref:S8 family serine peptidase n=1 Tax=Plantactinospora solaniradicis TaxID=1723736 RepID=A0ABW1K5R9_9ACTN
MRQRRYLAYGAAALIVAAGLVGTTPVGASAEPRPTPSVPAASERESTRVVTLFTGDRVTVHGRSITAMPRSGVHFLRYQREKSDYLVPSDALPLLKADRLDERLFNVTELLGSEFDKLSYLPLLVSDAARVRGLADGPDLAAVDGFATKVPIGDLARTWQTTRTSLTDGKIWLDGVRRSTLDVSVPRVGAPAAWQAGYDGSGVRVAVLDTGIDDSHPDLAGKVVERKNFVPEYEGPADLVGHGTHVSSTIVGSGAASAGRYKGVAPGAALLDGKVCYRLDDGRGVCPDSAVIAGMQWAAESGAKVVNMSLGGTDEPGVDPLEAAVNDLTAEFGTLFVVAAGNANPFAPYRVASPSTADAALSVANWTKTGELNTSSLPGPRVADYAVKPDIAAPGTEIMAARAPAGLPPLPEGQYFSATGTSMASPHVAGAAALLAQAHPDWRADQTKATLMASAEPLDGADVFGQGAGHVQVGRALGQQVTVTPPSLGLGALEWPLTDGPTSRKLTYHNSGTAAVTLDLAVDGTAPAGLLALGASTVTVPAGGAASVDVTVDERIGGEAYGVFSGRLVATADGVSLGTPFSTFREPPAASLNVRTVGRGDTAPITTFIKLRDLASGEEFVTYEPAEHYRVPLNSTWAVTAAVVETDGTVSFLANPRVVADRNQEVPLDAGRARPIDITVPDRKAVPYDAQVALTQTGDGRWWTESVQGDPRTIRTAGLGPRDVPGIGSYLQAVFQGPARDGASAGGADVYQLGWHVPGSFVTGFTRRVRSRDLATVTAEYARNAPEVESTRYNQPLPPEDVWLSGSALPPVQPPVRRTEYYGGNLGWQSTVVEEGTAVPGTVTSWAHPTAAEYRAGRSYRERWNAMPITVTVAQRSPGWAAAVREGDTIRTTFDTYTDAAGHLGLPYGMQNHELTLRQGDTLLGAYDFLYGNWQVGVEAEKYRMRYAFDIPTPLVTRLESEWTFRTSAEQQGELPLTTIGFAPELAIDNSARTGSRLAVPLVVTQQATAGKVRSAEVSVSFDDGRTWQKVPTRKLREGYVATIQHPRQAGHVSLRAYAVDSAGNTVTSTVIRAYAIR